MASEMGCEEMSDRRDVYIAEEKGQLKQYKDKSGGGVGVRNLGAGVRLKQRAGTFFPLASLLVTMLVTQISKI